MKGVTGARRCGEWVAVMSTCSLMLVVAATGPAGAAGCEFEPQGEGRVIETKAAPIDHGGDTAFALWLERAIGGVGRSDGCQHEK